MDKEVEKKVVMNIVLSAILSIDEWFFFTMEGKLRQKEKQDFNKLMKGLNKYSKVLQKSMRGGAEEYLETNKDYFIQALQSLYEVHENSLKEEEK